MTTQELNEKVQSMIAKGCKLPVEKIEAIFLTSDKNKSKNDKRKTAGFTARAKAETRDYSNAPSLEEINRRTSMNCRPSSMR